MEDALLVNVGAGPQAQELHYQPSAARFYILLAFCLLSFNQSLFWITFSPVASSAKAYYGIDDGMIALLMNWGPIVYIPICGLTSWLTAQKNGLRRVCVGSAVATGVAMVVRCIPCIYNAGEPAIGPLPAWGAACLHFAQIVNAAVGPPVMASPSLLSAQWFPDDERNRATATAILANNFGAAVGFIVPYFLDIHSSAGIPKMLYFEAAVSVGTMLMVLAYFPAAPPMPPSASALAKAAETPPPFCRGVSLAGRNGHFMLLAMVSHSRSRPGSHVLCVLLHLRLALCGAGGRQPQRRLQHLVRLV
eukprot:SAG11_NODE_6592_length_1282_cov_1.478445_2_plen_305_part_00